MENSNTSREIIATADAPAAIGPYSQAVKAGGTVWVSGQIPLDPQTMEIVEGGVAAQAEQVFKNLKALATAAGGTLDDAVKVNISLVDMGDFAAVNEVMERYFSQPYPARACVQVAALPRGVDLEIEMIMWLG